MKKQRKQNIQEGDDRISVLPEPIIHEILSHFHNTKAAARTSVLSKTWQRAWASFPRVIFDECHFHARSESPDYSPEENSRIRMKKNAFMTYIDKTLRSRDSSVDKFALHLTCHDKELLLPRVVEWLTIATERKVKVLDLSLPIIHFSDGNESGELIYYSLPQVVLEAKTITELRLAFCKLEPCNEFKFCHLKTLVLNHVRLDEQVIENLTQRCPLIEDFKLVGCHGLKHLKVSNLPRLNLLRVYPRGKVSTIEIKAPSLQSFCYCSYQLQLVNLHCDIYLEACKNLKRLKLVRLSNKTLDLLQNLSSKFPTLEVLEILTCKMASIKISSQTLKMFNLGECTDLEVVEVETPNLVSLQCRLMNKCLCHSFNAPSLQKVELELDLGSCFTPWLDKLKKLVGKFNSTEGLNLVIHSEGKVILLDGLNERVLASVIDLKDLRPTIVIISSMSSSDLVERILLDYSAKALSILSRSSKLLEVLNEKLLKKQFKSEGLTEYPLFDVKVGKIDGDEDPKYSEWIALLKSYKAMDYQTANFKIDWKHDIDVEKV